MTACAKLRDTKRDKRNTEQSDAADTNALVGYSLLYKRQPRIEQQRTTPRPYKKTPSVAPSLIG